MMIEDVLTRVIRDELRLQRKPIDFDLDAVVRVIAAEIEQAFGEADHSLDAAP